MDIGNIFSMVGNWLSATVHLIRGLLSNLVSMIGQNPSLIVPIILLILSGILAYLLVKKFITNPFTGRYILWYLIIVALIFGILNYV